MSATMRLLDWIGMQVAHQLAKPTSGYEPYAAARGVSYTVDHHGEGLDATMIEIRNDEILEPAGVAFWADRLARCLNVARGAHVGTTDHLSSPHRGGNRLEGRD